MFKIILFVVFISISLIAKTTNFEEFFDNNKDIMLVIDSSNGKIIKVNQSAIDFYGYSKKRFQRLNIKDINTFTKEQVKQEMDQAKAEDRNHFIFKHRLADNSIKRVVVNSYPFIYKNKEVLYSIIHEQSFTEITEHFNEKLNQQVDIQTKELQESKNNIILLFIVSTFLFVVGIIYLINLLNQRKKLTQNILDSNIQLSELKERLELAIDGSNDGVWDWNLETNSVYLSPKWKLMLGYKDEEYENSYKAWEDRVHLSDKDNTLKAIEKHLNKETQYYQSTFRMKHKDGSWIWITARGKAHFDKSGKATRMLGFHTDVTHLLSLQFDYKNLFNIVKEGVVVYKVKNNGENFIFKDINPAVEEIEKVNKDEIIGKDLLDMFPAAKEMGFVDILKKVHKTGETQFLPATKYDDGRISGYRRNHIYKLLNGDIVAVYEDLTQEYERIEKLDYQNKYLQAIFDIQPNIVITKHEKLLETVNTAFLNFFGISSISEFKKEYECICDRFIDKSGYLVPTYGDKTWLEYILERPNKIHKAIILKDNEEHEFIVKAESLNFDTTNRSLVVFIDITKIKEQEELIVKQEKRAVMGDMLENIAHQWRQPLSVITTMASGLQIQSENDMLELNAIDDSCETIIQQANHLSSTVDDFRNFFKVKREKEYFDLNDVLDRTIKLLSSKIKNREIIILKDIHSININGFANELVQVFMNIINNAIDELQEKEYDRVIKIDAKFEDDKIIISLSNNGGNIPVDIKSKIFNSHFTTKEHSDGTGIGLHMSKLIIENSFDGKIEVENLDFNYKNSSYDGVRFILTLPQELDS